MYKRLFVGIAGIPLIIFLIYLGGIYFFALTLILNFFCLYEFFELFEKKGYNPLKYFTIIISYILIAFAYKKDFFVIEIFLIFFVLIVALEIFRKNEKQSIINPLISCFGIFYITLPFMLLNIMEYDFRIVLYLIILIWLCDTFAYIIGKFFGKHKLSDISPKKTVEGTIGGLIFTLIGAFVFQIIQPQFLSIKDTFICGLIVGVFGQIGDLFESMLKRYSEKKDSSEMLPGHGGILDRFDSLIFVTPLIYIYFNFYKF